MAVSDIEMSMRDGSWDEDQRWLRDAEREPSSATSRRPRPELSERGSVRVAHEQAANIDTTARILLRDDGVRGPCGVEYLAPKHTGASKRMRARCTACEFIGREVGPAAGGDAYDEAKKHVCAKAGAA